MIITISGKPGSGKSTVARLLAKRLNVPHFSAGGFMRDIARQRRLDVTELARRAESDLSINALVDERTIELSHHALSFVMDGRMAWRFIPSGVKVLLVVSEKEASRRLREREPKRFKSLAAALAEVRARTSCERAQFKAQYGVDFLAKKNYDVVIDTTERSAEDVVALILEKMKSKEKKD